MTKSLRVIQGNRKYQTHLLPGYLVEYTPRCQIRAASFRVTLSIHFFCVAFPGRYMQTRRRHWNYVTHHNAIKGELHHCHRQHAHKYWWRLDVQIRRYACSQTDTHTTHKHAHHNTPLTYRQRSSNRLYLGENGNEIKLYIFKNELKCRCDLE